MAPTTAVCAVMIPVVTDVVLGERLAPLTMLGIALVSQQEAAAGPVAVRAWALPPGVGLALPSGVAIGLFFLALAETDAQAGMWPVGGEFVGIRHRSIFRSREPGVPRDVVAMA